MPTILDADVATARMAASRDGDKDMSSRAFGDSVADRCRQEKRFPRIEGASPLFVHDGSRCGPRAESADRAFL